MTLVGRLLAALALVLTASCSIVSGWSDLQGGVLATKLPPTDADAGSFVDSGTALDVGADAALPPMDRSSPSMPRRSS